MNWAKTGNIATVVASIVAILALFWQLKSSNELSNSEFLRRWQQTVVFLIISDNGVVGEDFDSIKTKYLQKVRQKFSAKLDETESIQDSTLTLLLIQLRSLNLVYKSIDNKYKEVLVRDQSAIEENNEYIRRRELNIALVEIMSKKSCKLSVEELEKYLLVEVKSEFRDISLAINAGIASRYLTLNEEKKLCLLQDYDPQKFSYENIKEEFVKYNKDRAKILFEMKKKGNEMLKNRVNKVVEEIREKLQEHM